MWPCRRAKWSYTSTDISAIGCNTVNNTTGTNTGAGFWAAVQMLMQIQVAAMAQIMSRRKSITIRLSTLVDMTTAKPAHAERELAIVSPSVMKSE